MEGKCNRDALAAALGAEAELEAAVEVDSHLGGESEDIHLHPRAHPRLVGEIGDRPGVNGASFAIQELVAIAQCVLEENCGVHSAW